MMKRSGGALVLIVAMWISCFAQPSRAEGVSDANLPVLELLCKVADWQLANPSSKYHQLQEASGTGFFCYGLAYGINNKILDESKARPALEKAFSKLGSFVTPEGKLTHVQPPGVDPKTFDVNTSDVYGVGAFLLAGSEIVKFETPLKVLR